MSRTDKPSMGLCPSWYGEEECTLSSTTTFQPSYQQQQKLIETFAINLLSAELRMRRCERHEFQTSDYSDDINSVRCMLPHLIHYSDTLGNLINTTNTTSPSHDNNNDNTLITEDQRNLITKLQTRSHWLAAIFNLWWSRHSPNLGDI